MPCPHVVVRDELSPRVMKACLLEIDPVKPMLYVTVKSCAHAEAAVSSMMASIMATRPMFRVVIFMILMFIILLWG